MAIGRTNAGGGGFNKSVIIVTAPTGSTVTCTKGTTVKTATEKNGEWWFKGLEIGTWTLKATLSGQTATQTVNITQFDVYRVTMAYFKATIKVTYPVGSTCTCSKGGEVLTAPNTSGSYTFTVTSAGTWTVKCTNAGRTASDKVSVTASGQSKSVVLAYNIYLFNNGDQNTAVTGGWKDDTDVIYSSENDGHGTVSIGDVISCSSATWVSAYAVTFNAIDVTGYNTLVATVASQGGKIYELALTKIKGPLKDNAVAYASLNQATVTLDISDVDGKCFVCVGTAGGPTVKVSKLELRM